MRIQVDRELRKVRDRFDHLHVHTDYSVLDGACRVERGALSIRGFEVGGETLVARAKMLGQPAVAITDHGSLGGYLRFVRECNEKGVRPIVGVEFYVADDLDVKVPEVRYAYHHLIVLAKSWRGLQALFRLTTLSWERGFYQKPRIDEDALMAEKGNDLIVLSGCVSSRLAQLAIDGRRKEAKRHVQKMVDAFGDDYWIEVQPHPFGDQVDANVVVRDVAEELGVGLVATNDAHYLCAGDARDHEVLLAIQTNGKMADEEGRFKFGPGSYHIADRSEMAAMFAGQGALPRSTVSAALDNAVRVSEGVEIVIPKMQGLAPIYETPEQFESKRAWIRHLCMEGWERCKVGRRAVEVAKERGCRPDRVLAEYRERMERELASIDEMGYLDYFVTVREIYEFARRSEIMRGPGRGSVGGSLVAFLLGITMVDPIVFGLSFERFLNPARKKSPPDIDMDFADDRRHEIVEWIENRFGRESVAHIGTWGTLGGKGAFRDVCRVHGVPRDETDRAAKLIADVVDPAALSGFPRQDLVRTAANLEGLIRSKSTHAAGIVVSPKLREVVPLELRGTEKDRKVTTALTGKEVETLGLLKLDVLGLSTLTALSITLDEIRRNGGDVDLLEIPMSDPEVFRHLSEGRTAGVFQFDSHTGSRECANMVFESFEDVVVMAALQRPGTLGSGTSEEFYARRRGDKPVRKVHPAYDKVTERTLGIIVFEEQVSELFRELAGFSPEKADIARRVVAKSQGTAEFEKMRGAFVSGAAEAGMSTDSANRLFDRLVSFSGYAFNRAHATEYSMITWWTAWLREHWPAEFWAGRLTIEDDRDRASELVGAARMRGVDFLPPHVDRSGWAYRTEVVDDRTRVRVGFAHLLGVGAKAAASIESVQPFSSPEDFLDRVDRRVVNKGVVESLILAGAFGPESGSLWKRRERFLSRRKGRGVAAGQVGLFPEAGEEEGWTEHEARRRRFEVLTLPIDGSPIDLWRSVLSEVAVETVDLREVVRSERSVSVVVKVFVTQARTKRRKGRTGEAVLDCMAQDETATVKCRFSEDRLMQHESIASRLAGSVAVIEGRVLPGGSTIFVDHAVLAEDLAQAEGSWGDLPWWERWLIEPPVSGEVEVAGRVHVPVDSVRPGRAGKKVRLVGGLSSLRTIMTRKGRRMAFASLRGSSGLREVIVWPSDFANLSGQLEEGKVVAARFEWAKGGGLAVDGKAKVHVFDDYPKT